jgi:L-amino acid N-acyltransferase YncA
MIIEKATHRDVTEVQNLLFPEYFNETVYSTLEYDPIRTRLTVTGWLSDVFYVVRDQGKIVGFFSMFIAYSFFKKGVANVDTLYVHPDYRGTKVGRMLVEKLVEESDKNDCASIHASCASGIGDKNNLLHTNLFKKFGFRELGTEVVRLNNVIL